MNHAVLVAVSICGLLACSESDPFIVRHCKFQDDPRVSANRVVTLVALNHVYVSARDDQAAQARYLATAEQMIAQIYDVANGIFRANGINLQIVPLAVREHIDELLDVYDQAGLGGQPTSVDIDEMVRFHQGFSDQIGVHWSEWDAAVGTSNYEGWGPLPCDSSANCACAASPRCNWVLLANFIHSRQSITLKGTILAHEFGHYFNLNHVTDPGNLMVAGDINGISLTSVQRQLIWTTINTLRLPLISETCDAPLAVAPRPVSGSPVPEPTYAFNGTPSVSR